MVLLIVVHVMVFNKCGPCITYLVDEYIPKSRGNNIRNI